MAKSGEAKAFSEWKQKIESSSKPASNSSRNEAKSFAEWRSNRQASRSTYNPNRNEAKAFQAWRRGEQYTEEDPYEQYKKRLTYAETRENRAEKALEVPYYEAAYMDMPSFGELWKQRQEYRDARVNRMKAEKSLTDAQRTGEAMTFLQQNGGDLDKAIEAATAGLDATSGKTGLFTDKQTRTQARSDRDRYQSYLDVYQSFRDRQTAEDWVKNNSGNGDLYKTAQDEYNAASAEIQRLEMARKGMQLDETGSVVFIDTNKGSVEDQLARAVKQQRLAGLKMEFAQNEQDDEVTRDADFASKAAEGQRRFEEYKASQYVSPEAEAEHERTVARHAPTGNDPTASQEAAQAAEFEFMEREANASRYDPRYHREYMEPDERWTDEERQIFYAKYRDDEEDAADYAARINRRYNSEDAAERDLYTEEFATRNALTGAIATAASIPGHLGAGNIDYAKMALEYAYRGDLYETQYEGWSRDSDVARSAIAQKLNEVGPTIDESVPVLGGKGFGDLYQIGASMAESAVAVSMGGGVANAMFFGSAASSATRDALDRGLSAGQALGLGAAAGAAEVGGETLSIEHLLNQGGLQDVLAKGVFREMLKQGGVEASEEFLTTLANTFADKLISGDKSEYKQNLYTNLANGMSYDEAQRAAFQEWAYGIAMDTLGGFISGAGMSGMRYGGMALKGATTKFTGDRQQLFDTARLTEEGSKAQKLADKYENKEKLSSLQAAKIQAASNVELGKTDKATLTEAATKRLQELGVKNPQKAAEAIADVIAGTVRSDVKAKQQMRLLENNGAALDVLNDLENALSGKNVEWAKGIQTKNTGRISEAYQRMSDRTRNVTIDGQTHKIERLSMDGGKLNVTYTANGTEHTISADDAKLSPDVQSALKTVKEILGDDAEYALERMERYQNPYDYAVSYATIRDTFGKEGAKESAALASPLRGGLSDTQVIHAMARGYVAHRVTGKTKRGAGVVTTNGGMLNGRELQGVSEDILKNDQDAANYVQAWSGLAQAMGINVRFFQGKTDSQGRVVYGSEGDPNGAYYNGELWLDINAGMKELRKTAERSVFRTAAHELTHFIEHNSNKYEELKEFVTGYLKEAMGEDFNALVKSKIAREPGLSYEGAIHEVVADACETMLKDSKYINKMMDENPGLFETIRGWLRDFFNKILAVDTGAKYLQPVIDQVQKLWDDALQDAVESRLSDETMADPLTFEEAAAVEPEVAQKIVQEEKPAKVKKPAKQKAERNEPWLNNSLSKSEKEKLRRRFNVAKDELISSYDLDGIDITEEEAKKILPDYYATTGYYSLSDEYRQTKNTRKKESWATERAVKYGEAITPEQEVQHSLKHNDDFMTAAINYNAQHGNAVSAKALDEARRVRKLIADTFNDPSRKLNLPEDVMGNTFISNSSYGGTEENTTVCIRSLAAQALMDEIGKSLGRPLTVDETLLLSQEIANYTDKPECFYCYVATDRRAYREYLGNYLQQRDDVLKKAKRVKTEAQRQALYKEFLYDRKDTANMRTRFNMWLNTAQENLITGADIASVDDLAKNIAELQKIKNRTEEQSSRLRQLKDAAAYAQSASWAKKIQGYTAYNGHILKWKQKKINDFNSHYGLRMYSFSDFSAAFILENMQMITDASVKGLKMLAYTKEIAFAEIFAQTGMNINISVYASHANGQIIKDGMQGADWDAAIELRNKYPNIGITLVATSDDIVQWGLENPDVDVVIPYHLVRTGQAVADYFGFKNYTSVSADGKLKAAGEYKGKPTSVYPSVHQNDIVAYVRALEKYDLSPRFEDYLTGWKEFLAGEMSKADFRAANPYYMKLVNETRRSAQDTPAVQPKFNEAAAMAAINEMEQKGGYGIAEVFGRNANFIMEDIVDEVTEKINNRAQLSTKEQISDQKAQFSMKDSVEETTKLVAVHNKSVSGLRRMLQRGGVPFPSIAIKKAGTSHEGFGDVSIVFPRSTIDPKANKQNRLYSNDAWTPTEPRTEYDVGDMWRYIKRLQKELGDRVFVGLHGGSYLSEDEIAKKLLSSEGDIFEALKNINVLKYAYLHSIGKTPALPEKSASLDGFGKYKNDQLLAIFDRVSADDIESMTYDSTDTLQKIADVLNEKFLEGIQDREKRERIRNSEKLLPYKADKINPRIIQDAYKKYTDNGGKLNSEVDFYEFDRQLRDNKQILDDPGYKAWIEDYFSDLIVDEGIPNGKDIYTDSGNRRSFKQRHVPATLENIVRQMQKENERGIGLFGINLRGAATKAYSTVEEMRADSGKLLGTHVSDDVYDSYMSGFHNRLNEMVSRASQSDRWESLDSTQEILLEALRDSSSKAQMDRKLKAESRFINVYDGLTDELWQLREDVQNMPAPYFEAKPRRIVYPEEALAYILPDSGADDVQQMLEQRGYNVLTYKTGDEQDRLAKLNSIPNAQFSTKEQLTAEEQEASVKAQREVAQGVKPRLNTYAVKEVGIETAAPEVASDLQAAPYVQHAVKGGGLVNPDGITYDGIGERYFAYDEGDRPPDLTPVETQFRKWDDKAKQYKYVKDITIKFAGDRPKNYVPKRVGKAYKVMEQWPDGTVHPLFAGSDIPIEFGNWQWGKGYQVEGLVKTMGLRPRYAWHISTLLPTAAHLMGVGDSLNPQPIYPSKGGPHPKGSKRVWVELEYDASTDYNGLVDTLGSSDGDVLGLMPFGGYYVYKEKNMSEWVLSSGVRFTRVLEESERQQILKDAGYDEYEAWQKGKLSQTIAAQITSTTKALAKETNADKRAALQAKLDRLDEINSQNPYAGWKAPKYTKEEGDAHLQEVRRSVESRIYDNPEAERGSGEPQFSIKHRHWVASENNIRYNDSKIVPAYHEMSSFNRALANKTNGLKDGQNKLIQIATPRYWYLIDADGYMSGEVIKAVSVSENRNVINDILKEVRNGAYRSGSSPYSTAEGEQNGGIGYSRDDAVLGNYTEQNSDGKMDRFQEEADAAGDFESYSGYNSYDELTDAIESGAMIMGPDGSVLSIGNKPQNSVKSGQRFFSKEDIDAEISRLNDEIADLYSQEGAIRDNPEYRKAQEKLNFADTFKEKVAARRELKQVKERLGSERITARLNEIKNEIDKLKDLRKKYLSVTTISEQDYAKLKKHFGVTNDFDVAGFILKDGTALDFSGRQQYKDYAGGREIYHNEIGDVIGMPKDTSPRINMLNNGNIRLVPETSGINLAAMPTAAQISTLRDFIDHNDGAVQVDIDDIGGDTIESFTYYRGTSSSKIVSDIRNYFNNGVVPEPSSGLRAYYSVKTDELSDRDMLLNANSTTDAELAALQDYQAKAQNYTAREKQVSDALREMDRMVRAGASKDAINKQRSKISNLEAGMAKALRELTQAEQGTTIQEILQRERDIQRRRTRQQVNETLSKRELRRRIDALHKSLVSRIKNPTEKKNIPPAVMQQAIDVLEAINMDTTIPGSKRGESVRSKLVELKQRYEELKNDKDFRAAAVYDSQVAEFLENMIKEVGDTPINRMSASQLESVYNVLAALDRTARKALKIRIGNQERDAYEISKAMTRETRSSKKQHTSLLDSYLNAQLSPERFFARMGNHHKNSTWSQIYRMLNDGQLKQTQITMEASMIFGDLLTDKRYDKLIDPKQTVDLGLKDENGKTILITHGMMVALYMHLQNEQNVRHVAYGGLTIPSLKDYYNGKKVKGSENASRVGGVLQEVADLKDQLYETMDAQTAADLQARIDEAGLRAMDYIDKLRAAIDKHLTDYDRQWIAASKELFDGYSKSRLNETTMDVYGIKRANVDNYFPIWVDGDFLNTPFETVAKDMSLENAGFMKERIDSSKPIRLADISDVASSQIRKVSQYCGLMPVIRNFNKIWGKTQTGYRDSVQNAVHQVYGNSGIKYIENLMADLNGARNGGESSLVDMLNAVRGHMAQASLTLNPRVAFGQTASFPSAAAVVGWDALRKAFFKGGKNGQMISRADQDLIRKWSPLLWYRMQGYSTTELGDIAGMNSKVDRIWKKARWLTGWIQAMDGATVGRLWYAAEYYVQDNTKLEKGSDAYYEKVAEIFNDIVERTQPNYTIMQRPDILRNPQALVKQLTMFLTQRLQNFNVLYDSLATYSQAKQDLKDHAFDTTAEDVRQAGIGARRAVISQVAAAATITAFKFLADALLHSMSAYRDDDKELTKESISLQLLNMFMDSLTGNLLGGSEIYDIIESKVFNKTYYGVELSGISTVMDVVNSTTGFVETAFNKEADSKAKLKAADKLAKNLGSLVGLPFANAEKIVKGFLYTAQDIANGDPWQTAGVDRTTSQQANRLYKAYEDMQYGKVQKIREEVGDDEKLDTQIKSMIKERFVGSELSGTDAVHHLTTWLGVRDKDAEKIVREWQCERDTGIKYDDMREAFLAGQISAKSAANMRIKYGGMQPADAEKTVSKWQCEIDTGIPYEELRTEFIDGNISYNQIVTYMVKYGGRDQEDAEKSAYQYQFIGEDDQYSDVSVTAATKYYAGGFEAAGISKDYYLEIYTMADTGFKADYKANGQPISNSKKIKVMAYIDSLPISDALKDQLYLIDYKESTLAKTPWNKRR